MNTELFEIQKLLAELNINYVMGLIVDLRNNNPTPATQRRADVLGYLCTAARITQEIESGTKPETGNQ